MNKILKPKLKVPMEIMTTDNSPFEKCSLDIVGPLPIIQEGNNYILTFQDNFSKYLIAVPIHQQSAETCALAFVSQVILKYGTPSIVQNDQGANFVSEIFKNMCKLLRIRKIQSTAFHPESQGGLKRSHGVMDESLRYYVDEDQTNWDEWVPFATCVQHHRTLRHGLHSIRVALRTPIFPIFISQK
jgi:hypothetical protein